MSWGNATTGWAGTATMANRRPPAAGPRSGACQGTRPIPPHCCSPPSPCSSRTPTTTTTTAATTPPLQAQPARRGPDINDAVGIPHQGTCGRIAPSPSLLTPTPAASAAATTPRQDAHAQPYLSASVLPVDVGATSPSEPPPPTTRRNTDNDDKSRVTTVRSTTTMTHSQGHSGAGHHPTEVCAIAVLFPPSSLT